MGSALIRLPIPLELTSIKTVTQNLLNGAGRYFGTALAVPEAGSSGHLSRLFQGDAACRIPFKQLSDDRRAAWIDLYGLLTVRPDDVFEFAARMSETLNLQLTCVYLHNPRAT